MRNRGKYQRIYLLVYANARKGSSGKLTGKLTGKLKTTQCNSNGIIVPGRMGMGFFASEPKKLRVWNKGNIVRTGSVKKKRTKKKHADKI